MFHVEGTELPLCWNSPKDWEKDYIKYEWATCFPEIRMLPPQIGSKTSHSIPPGVISTSRRVSTCKS